MTRGLLPLNPATWWLWRVLVTAAIYFVVREFARRHRAR